MIDTRVAISGLTINFYGISYVIREAVACDDGVRVEVEPRNSEIETAVANAIGKSMPLPPSIEEITAELVERRPSPK